MFFPLLWWSDEFMQWARRTGLRLRNLPPDAPEHLTRRALFSEGTPSADWAEALTFVMTFASIRNSCQPAKPTS